MSEVLIDNMRIAEGYLTLFDNGDYILIEGELNNPNARSTYFQRGHGPYGLELLIERYFANHQREESLRRERAVKERLQSLEARNTALRRRLRQSTEPESESTVDTASRRVDSSPLIREANYLPPSCSSPAIPVTQDATFNLGIIPPGTIYCSFSPAYEIFGQSVRIRLTAVSPPVGDWGVSLFECPYRFAQGGQCNRRITGKHSYFGSNTNDFNYHYNPFFWVSRKIFFRIRNGSSEPIHNVQLNLQPQNRDPLLQMIHDVLSVLGILPGIGVVADGTDLFLYILEGDWGSTAISAAAIIPVFGDSARVIQIGSREVIRVSRVEIQQIGEQVIRERLERVIRESGNTASRERPVRDPLDEGLDRAFEGPFETGEMRSSGRIRRPRSQALVPHFDDLLLTASQRAAFRRISGTRFRNLPGFHAAWEYIMSNNPRALRDMAEIQRLYLAHGVTDAAIIAAQQQQARQLAREAYNRARGRFWTYVRRSTALKQQLEEAGLHFSGTPTSAPYWLFPDGYRELLTIEHMNRVTDQPWRSMVADNLQFVPHRENVRALEFLRGLPGFEDF